MTLNITTAEDSERQLKLTIEIDETRVRKAMQQKARELGREVHIPGFRPGKAPYDVIVRRVGEDVLRAEAVEDMAQSVFEEALEQTGLEPYARSTLDDIQPQPLVYTFTVPLDPVVTLGDYRARRKELEPIQVTDEAVSGALEYVQMRHQIVEAVDRAAEPGDVVTLSGHGRLVSPEPEAEGDAANATGEGYLFNEESLEVLLDAASLFPETPFVDNVVGMSVGEQKAFSFTFPDPYESEPEFAGREATFDITVTEVKRRELPPIDDELAKLEGNYESLDELRAELRRDLEREAENASKETVIEEMIDFLLEDAQVVYPPAAVDLQIDQMVEDFNNRLARSGWQPKEYLNLQGMTEESLREDFRDNAVTQLRRQLVLRQFILDEKLRVDAADIDNIIEERLERFENPALKDSMRSYYQSGRGFELVSSEVLSNKVYERVKAILSGQAPDLDSLDDVSEAGSDEEE